MPANPLAQQHDDLDRDLRLAFEVGEKILAAQHEQFGRLAGGGIGGAALAVEHRDLAEQVARAHEIQGQPPAVGGPGFDPDLAAADPEQRVAAVALLEQDLADAKLLGVAEAGYPVQLVGAEVREHRIHLQDNRKFGLFAHRNAFRKSCLKSSKRAAGKIHATEVCHKSHSFAAPPDYFCAPFSPFPIPG